MAHLQKLYKLHTFLRSNYQLCRCSCHKLKYANPTDQMRRSNCSFRQANRAKGIKHFPHGNRYLPARAKYCLKEFFCGHMQRQTCMLDRTDISSLHTQCIRKFHKATEQLTHIDHKKISKQEISNSEIKLLPIDAELDWEYMCDPSNTAEIEENIRNRKGVGNVCKMLELWEKLHDSSKHEISDYLQSQTAEEAVLRRRLMEEALQIPNTTHPDVPIGDEDSAKQIDLIGDKPEFAFSPKTVIKLGEDLDVLRVENVGITSGQRSYYFKKELAQLEQALIRFTISKLLDKGFTLMSVPDLIHPYIIEGCGFATSGERSQVYKLDSDKHDPLCLAGTAEMSLAGYFMDRNLILDQLPHKVAAVSRCFRAEASGLEEEKGIYRVHQFSKVEMFCVTANQTGQESNDLMMELMEIQRELFSQLGLHFRILDMPSQELGAPAYRKFDIEAWMPAKQFYGEISSTSNCTDYQSRRLHIKYREADNELKFAHTVNGTACAIPRMIMAIMENYQLEDGSVKIPVALQSYMRGMTEIKKSAKPQMSWIKFSKTEKKKKKRKS